MTDRRMAGDRWVQRARRRARRVGRRVGTADRQPSGGAHGARRDVRPRVVGRATRAGDQLRSVTEWLPPAAGGPSPRRCRSRRGVGADLDEQEPVERRPPGERRLARRRSSLSTVRQIARWRLRGGRRPFAGADPHEAPNATFLHVRSWGSLSWSWWSSSCGGGNLTKFERQTRSTDSRRVVTARCPDEHRDRGCRRTARCPRDPGASSSRRRTRDGGRRGWHRQPRAG